MKPLYKNQKAIEHHATNYTLAVNVANKEHREKTGQTNDRFRYNDTTGDLYAYDTTDGIYKKIINLKHFAGGDVDI